LAIPKPPVKVTAPRELLVLEVVLVELVMPPTNNLLAIPTPPAVVMVPPLVEDTASVVLLVAIPPDNNKAPVVLLVDTVVVVPLITVKEAVDGVVPPMAPGAANVAPDKEDAFKLATLVVDATVKGEVPVDNVEVITPEALKVVNAAVEGVVPPIAPGAANVAPDKEDAFKLVTFVVLDTVNGAVPVETVETNVFAVTDVPTKSCLAIAAPPAKVILPPLLLLVASVVLLVAIPPDNSNAPVVLLVVAVAVVPVITVKVAVEGVVPPITPGAANVAPDNVLAFKLATLVVDATVKGAVPVETVESKNGEDTDVPTNSCLAIAAPPAKVILPPLVEDTASVVLLVAIPPDNSNVPVVLLVLDVVVVPVITVKEAVEGVVPPIAPGVANVAPDKEDAFKLATLVVDATVKGAVPVDNVEVIAPEALKVVKAAVDGVVPPIAPGAANVAPDNVLAFKLATFVVLDTVNGAVPVETVETKNGEDTDVPTKSCLAIATPPAKVILPPLLLLVASVVLLVAIPPDNSNAPVMLLVLDVVLLELVIPPTSKFVPTKSFLAIATPPAVVIVPPLLLLVASVVLLIPIPPLILKDPVTDEVDVVPRLETIAP